MSQIDTIPQPLDIPIDSNSSSNQKNADVMKEIEEAMLRDQEENKNLPENAVIDGHEFTNIRVRNVEVEPVMSQKDGTNSQPQNSEEESNSSNHRNDDAMKEIEESMRRDQEENKNLPEKVVIDGQVFTNIRVRDIKIEPRSSQNGDANSSSSQRNDDAMKEIEESMRRDQEENKNLPDKIVIDGHEFTNIRVRDIKLEPEVIASPNNYVKSIARKEIDTFCGHEEYEPNSNFTSLARKEIDTFCGHEEYEPNYNFTSLARKEIDTFHGRVEDDQNCIVMSLARKELDTFHGLEEENIKVTSLARKEIDTFCGHDEYKHNYKVASLAREEIDTFLGIEPEQQNLRVASLARKEIDAFHGHEDNEDNDQNDKVTSLAREEIDTFNNLQENKPLSKAPSLQNKEIDIFRSFQENEITDIEILPNATFRCLYTTSNDMTFQKFVSEIKDDPITTIHFKKSMIYEKYFTLCTDYHALLIPYESTDQINEALSQIQNSKVFCITEKDQDKLSNFENHKLIKSFATNDDLEILRETLHARLNERFEVFNTAQSVMVCHQTTYMTFFYLTEEVFSTYYDLKTKGHKFLKTAIKSNFSYQSTPIKNEDLSNFNELYQSLEDKIKVIHRYINDNDSYTGIDSAIVDINDMLQLSANHQKKKDLTDCIKTYEKANRMIKEAEDSVCDFIQSIPSTQGSLLPSLNKSSAECSNSGNEIIQESSDRISISDDFELKSLKYEVNSLQNQINDINQQIKVLSGTDSQLSNSLQNAQRRLPREPLIQQGAPTSPRNAPTYSPRAMRNRLRSMQKKVNEGDPSAMYSLGACYALGDGVQEDKEKALHYYMLAAEKGNKNAQYAAAACYSYGKGTSVDKNKAFELYLQAANQGHPKAQFAVGHFYEYGQGGAERDHDKAKEWYRKAAEQGHSAARRFLEDCSSESQFNESNE